MAELNDLSIFRFQSYRDYLNVVAERYRGRKDRPFTLNMWAKRLGYRSPRAIAMVLKGQRLPSQDMIEAFSRDLKLSILEKRYFELLVRMERSKERGQALEAVVAELKQTAPQDAAATIGLDQFTYISAWYCLAIKQLVGTTSFREDLAWIRKRLRNKLTEAEVRDAIATMIKIGVLARGADGKLAVVGGPLVTASDLPSHALRSHHREMMERAREALVEQKVDQREFTGLTLKVDRRRIAEAKEEIRKFRDRFNERFGDGHADAVYQLNVQFFEHTISEEEEV